MRTFFRLSTLLLLMAAPLYSWAQSNPNIKPEEVQHFYHLVFRLQDFDDAGKMANTRSYVITVGKERSSIRLNTRIPIKVHDLDTSIQMDNSVKIDCDRATESDGQFIASISAEFNNKNLDETLTSAASLVRQYNWNSVLIVPFGKPTVIYSSDNLNDKGKMQIELTATRVR